MLLDHEKRLIEDNMDKLEIIIKVLAAKFNISKNEIDDYRQSGYLAICKKVHKYDGSTKFSTFANTVMTHAFIDKYRKDKSQKMDVVSLDDICSEDDDGSEACLMDFLASDNNTENEVLASVTNDMIKNYIKDAKVKCTAQTTVKGFEALELKLEGYSGEEIANMFNVPSNSVRSWMSRAKKALLNEHEFVELIRG